MSPTEQDLQEQIDRLRAELEGLTKVFYQNNFSSHQDFNKASSFNYRLKIPSYPSVPSVTDVGELIEVGGVLYISTGVDTWTVVGTQT